MNKISAFTNNISVSNVLVILTAIGFFILLFPVHIYNYVYVNTKDSYASVNVSAYRLIRILNANTIKNSPDKMQINGKDKKFDKNLVNVNYLKIYNNLCLTKVIQLGDFGIQSDKGAYFALFQNTLSQALYAFVKVNGGRTKLKNYTVLNEEHGDVLYYAKVVGVINLLTLTKIISILILEKLNEINNQE